MKLILLTFGLFLASLNALGAPCELVLNDKKGDFRTIPVDSLKGPPEEGTSSGKLKAQEGFYCPDGGDLTARMTYKDQEGESWVIKVSAEGMANGETLISLIQIRDNKTYGPQVDFTFRGKPCDFLKQKYPFSLIGQRTKGDKWFSVTLKCKGK